MVPTFEKFHYIGIGKIINYIKINLLQPLKNFMTLLLTLVADLACDQGGMCPPSILEKIYYPGIYPLKLSILHNFHSIFSLLSLRLSLWIFTVAPSSFSSSSSFVSSSSLPTRLIFDIFQAYKLSGNNPPTFILLQPRGSPYTILFTFHFLHFTFLNVFCFIFFLFFN